MKNIALLFGMLFCGASLLAQKVVNDPNAQVRPVGSFHAIQVNNAFDVIITQGSTGGVAVSASRAEEVEGIRTQVENGVLKISFEHKNKLWGSSRKLKAYVSVVKIDAIRASGASDITVEGTLMADNLDVQLSGASDMEGKLVVSGQLDVRLSGASDMKISGSARQTTIDLNGASDVKAYDYSTGVCKIEASGASSVRITVDKELSASLSGASSVSYKGSAVIRDIKTSGASSISRKS